MLTNALARQQYHQYHQQLAVTLRGLPSMMACKHAETPSRALTTARTIAFLKSAAPLPKHLNGKIDEKIKNNFQADTPSKQKKVNNIIRLHADLTDQSSKPRLTHTQELKVSKNRLKSPSRPPNEHKQTLWSYVTEHTKEKSPFFVKEPELKKLRKAYYESIKNG